MSDAEMNEHANSRIFSQRLRELRQSTGLTQTQFAEKVGLSKTAMTNYENAGKNPSLETALKIARAYDVSLDWLCGLADSKYGDMKTYADVVRTILRIGNALDLTFYPVAVEAGEGNVFQVDPSKSFESDEDEMQWHNIFSRGTAIYLWNNTLVHFFDEYSRMQTLLFDKVIDKSLLNLWMEKQLSDLNGRLNKDIPHAEA